MQALNVQAFASSQSESCKHGVISVDCAAVALANRIYEKDKIVKIAKNNVGFNFSIFGLRSSELNSKKCARLATWNGLILLGISC